MKKTETKRAAVGFMETDSCFLMEITDTLEYTKKIC